jgi:hypothetical protein
MRLREANYLVALAKIVGGSVGPQNPPLHRVLGLYHIELASESGSVGGLGKL